MDVHFYFFSYITGNHLIFWEYTLHPDKIYYNCNFEMIIVKRHIYYRNKAVIFLEILN